MRIDKIALGAAMLCVPALAVAQIAHTPLPPVPAVEPLYPSRATTSRVALPQPRPAVIFARAVALPAPVPRPATISLPPAPVVLASLPPPVSATIVAPVSLPAIAPAPATPVAMAHSLTLQPQTAVMLRLDEEVNSDGRKAGDVFRLTVVQDVTVGATTIIPRGSPAFGRVAWRTGKGAFGKSGKITIDLDRIEVAGRSIPLIGQYREEGRGRTGLTIGMAVAAGLVAAAFVKGNDGAFHAGRELQTSTRDAVVFDLPANPFRETPRVAQVDAAGG